MKIAQALLLRKQLEAKVRQLEPLKMNGENGVYKDEIQRVKVSDVIDEVKLKIARVDIKSITRDYDRYASELRRLDAAIQQANWQFDIEFSGSNLDAEETKEPEVGEVKSRRRKS